MPETTARFMAESARMVPFTLRPLPSLPHSFEPGPTPQTLRAVEQEAGWKGAALCYWLYVVTRCKQPDGPRVMLIGDPARLAWHEVKKVEHYQLSVDALKSQARGGTRE